MPTTTLSNPRFAVSLTASLATGAANTSTFGGAISHIPTVQTPTVGTTAGLVDKIYSNTVTLVTGTAATLDLTALTDPAGGTVAFAHVTHVLLENLDTVSGHDVTLYGGTSAFLATSTELLYAGGGGIKVQTYPAAGVAVAASNKNFKLDAAAGTAVTVNVTIMGRSA